MLESVKKILIPVDDSISSLNTIHYVTRVFPNSNIEIVLFHVECTVPEVFLDAKDFHILVSTQSQLKSWTSAREEENKRFMQKAKSVLIDAGFDELSIITKIQKKKVGIARDILKEISSDNYSLIIMGRNGKSNMHMPMIGTVTSKLIGKLTDIPLVIVGNIPVLNNKVLIAFDGSEGAHKAVTSVTSMLGKSNDCQITLLFVLRMLNLNYEVAITPDMENEWVSYAKQEIQPSMDLAYNHLGNNGFKQENITTEVILGMESRAGAIVEYANKHQIPTIVVGRRGLSFVQEFFMGRVGRKVMDMADKMAVWVVG
jgi:nucleotide-binding universal stress UspA family protein